MKTRRVLMISFLVIGLVTVATARAQEKKITRAELPPAVEKTVAEQSKGGTIRGFSTEVEDGKRLYEVELTVEGHGKDISMDEQGNVVEVEEELSMDTLPPSVRKGLTEAAGGGTIFEIESITKHGKLVAYEAEVRTAAKKSEIQVGPDGKRLAHPE
jgi:uncharacterized membrane protein YkoI